MTVSPLEEFTPEEAERMARMEAAPYADEAAVERIARALAAAWCERYPNDNEPWELLRERARDDYRFDAVAALAAMRPTTPREARA